MGVKCRDKSFCPSVSPSVCLFVLLSVSPSCLSVIELANMNHKHITQSSIARMSSSFNSILLIINGISK